MSSRFTAKITVTSVDVSGELTSLTFLPDYGQGRNAEWATATPSLSLAMNVKNAVAEGIQVGDAFTLTFEKEDKAVG